MEAPKEMSKRAAEKAKKKLEKAQKKQDLALRPKPADGKPDSAKAESSKAPEPSNMFAEGWLKRVYEEKPVAVRTRFPPEPNGFLHIGHAKAITVNFGFAKHHNGICFLRYDDTNPEKEEGVYFDSIKNSVEWLGFTPYQVTYSSDHFDRLYELAEELVQRDKAYVCHCAKDEVNLQRGGKDNRGPRSACSHRSRSVQENLTEFRAMRDGKYEAGEAHLRMKQAIDDRDEGNPQMWDLAAYRVIKKENRHHHRTGDKHKILPTYDFTHCICDAFEDISHSLCTTEFYLSRRSYDWLLEQLDMKLPHSDEKGPMQREYGRLNVAGTILSKRRIERLVKGETVEVASSDGTVTTKTIPPTVRGWDDPRLYTLVALRRRGVPAQALVSFVSELGVTDALTNIEIPRLESVIRRHLERTVPRLMLVLDPVRVVIEDLPEDHLQELTIPFDPKNPSGANRQVPLTRTVYIDRSDFREEDSKDFFRLAPGKTVGLLHAFTIRATSFVKDDATGRVTEIRAVKVDEAERPKAFIQWVASKHVAATARLYRPLFRTDEPNALDWKAGGWADNLNPDSEVIYSDTMVERGFEEVVAGRSFDPPPTSDDLVRFQGMRTGYFCVDKDSKESVVILNQIVSLKEDSGKGK